MRNITLILAVCTLAITIATSACSQKPNSESDTVFGSVLERFPSETLSDWTDHANQVSVVTVINEYEKPISENVRLTGEGYVGRQVSLRVEDNIWNKQGAEILTDGEVTISTWGWVLNDGEKIRFVPYGSERLEVGNRYVLALVSSESLADGQTDQVWGQMASQTVLLLEGEIITSNSHSESHANPVSAEVAGKTINQLEIKLKEAASNGDTVK